MNKYISILEYFVKNGVKLNEEQVEDLKNNIAAAQEKINLMNPVSSDEKVLANPIGAVAKEMLTKSGSSSSSEHPEQDLSKVDPDEIAAVKAETEKGTK